MNIEELHDFPGRNFKIAADTAAGFTT